MINIDKTQFINISAPSQKKLIENCKLQVGNNKVKTSESVKFLVVNKDGCFTFEKINKLLQKMASAIQTTKGIRDENPLRTRILLLNTLVLNNLLHPGMLLNSCTEEILEKLKKQLKEKKIYTN